MTEMTPLGTVSRLKSYQGNLSEAEKFAIRAKQGTSVPGVEIRAIDESGKEIPWDGKAFGELQVRGPWIISSYYNDDRSAESFHEGWFRTGDVVTIDSEGFVQIVDRAKDVIKSGGEWISSQISKMRSCRTPKFWKPPSSPCRIQMAGTSAGLCGSQT